MALRLPRPSANWLLVLGSAICFLIADGCTYSFGIFYTELSEAYAEDYSPTLIALLSGMLYGLPQISGPLVCPLIEALGSWRACALGCVCVSASFAVGWLTRTFVGLLLTLGLVTSVGLELLYATALSVVLRHFQAWRGLATGVTVFGGGLGALLFAEVYTALERRYTWRGAMLVEAGIFTHTAVAASLYLLQEGRAEEEGEEKDEEEMQPMKAPRVETGDAVGDSEDGRSLEEVWAAQQATSEVSLEERLALTDDSLPRKQLTSALNQSGLILNISSVSNPNLYEINAPKRCHCPCFKALASSFKDMFDPNLWSFRFTLLCIINFFGGVFIVQPWMFVHNYAVNLGYPFSSANHIYSAMGITYALGQISFGALADLANAYVLYGSCFLVCGLACFFMAVGASLASLIALGALFGAVMGGTMALYSLLLIDIVGEARLLPAFGVFLPFVGFGNLIGGPLSEWLKKVLSYESMFMIGGSSLMALSLAISVLAIEPVRKFGLRPVTNT